MPVTGVQTCALPIFTIIGAVLLIGGSRYAKAFSFPLFLLFFMVPIPAVIYNQITFPLQLLASQVAETSIGIVGIPVIREGNVLELAEQKLNVVEACSGIRSLLTLTFLSLVYGYFAEKKSWIRVALFFSTIPIAIAARLESRPRWRLIMHATTASGAGART